MFSSENSDFRSKLAFFQSMATGNTTSFRQNPRNYNNRPKKLNIYDKVQKAQEDQRKTTKNQLNRTKTESNFHSKPKGNNVQRFKENLDNKIKEEEKKKEQIQKEIHEI